jgi:hypothetical protein
MSNTTHAAPITAISKYRALVLVKAVELGWKHSQVSTNVDAYTKGTERIVLTWGRTQLISMGHMKGKAIVAEARGEAAGKLQRTQTQLGDPMPISKKWRALKAAEVEALEALATKTFAVKEVPAAKA